MNSVKSSRYGCVLAAQLQYGTGRVVYELCAHAPVHCCEVVT